MTDSSKIKVVIGINDFLVGGAQKLIIDQLKYFDRSKFEIVLITLFEFPDRKNFYSDLPSDIKCIRLNFTSFYSLKSWIRLTKELKKINPDLVCSHLFLSNTIFRILNFILGYKIITVEHNTYVYKKWYEIFMDKLLSKFTYKIVAVSKTVRNFASKQARIPANKFLVILNGIDLIPIKQLADKLSISNARRELGLNENDLIFVSLGRLTHQKNQGLMIKSFLKFLENHERAKLLILGEGSLLAELRKLAGKEESKAIRFIGAASHEVVLKYFRASDFLISTSLIEGLSVSYLEALASGLPLLATKTAGTDDLIKEGENGYFLQFDTEQITHTMSKALGENRSAQRQNCIKRAQEYDIKINVKKYEDLFSSSIN